MTPRGRKGGLPEADAALWARVLAQVRPLPGRTPPPVPAPPVVAPPPVSDAPPSKTAPTHKAPPDLAGIEARLARRLVRGVAAIDARLDLHGLRQEAAHRRLVGFLAVSQRRGDRVVLVITGKGSPDADTDFLADGRRGVLRRLVPLWLSEPALRAVVIGFSEAHVSHGGAGALYVRLRKARR